MARVRIATSEDLSQIADLCRAAVGADDYVLRYLDEMLGGRTVVVVEEGGRIGAMAGLTECADRALWIGQMRTHPGYRRRGFARMLLEHARTRAVREARPALRLWAGGHNIASRTLFETTGFREVASFTRMTAPALRGRAQRSDMDTRGRRAYRMWRQGLYRRAGAGYLAYEWHFLPVSLRTTQMLAARGQVFISGRAAVAAWVEEGDKTAYASILSGGRAGLVAARRIAGWHRRRRVEVFLPRHRTILAWASQAGFVPAAWGRHAVLYERRVRRS